MDILVEFLIGCLQRGLCLTLYKNRRIKLKFIHTPLYSQ